MTKKILDNIPTKQWVDARQHYIGGSEIAAALGESSYQTPLNLWLIKTGRIEPIDSTPIMELVHCQNLLTYLKLIVTLKDLLFIEVTQIQDGNLNRKLVEKNSKMLEKVKIYLMNGEEELYNMVHFQVMNGIRWL